MLRDADDKDLHHSVSLQRVSLPTVGDIRNAWTGLLGPKKGPSAKASALALESVLREQLSANGLQAKDCEDALKRLRAKGLLQCELIGDTVLMLPGALSGDVWSALPQPGISVALKHLECGPYVEPQTLFLCWASMH
jgi:hypothetical protein